jgi:dynein heavy chain, axonemal
MWMTTAPCADFPESVLQASAKITVEPPIGLRGSVVASLQALPEDIHTDCETSNSSWRCVLYTIVLFHAVAQERRRYGALGWNVPYDFAETDLLCSLRTAKNLMSSQSMDSTTGLVSLSSDHVEDKGTWGAITYILGQIHYGGRVTDENDRALLAALIKHYINPDLLHGDTPIGKSTTWFVQPSLFETLQSMQTEALQLPAHGHPELLGLHQSAAFEHDLQQSLSVLRSTLALQPQTLHSGSTALHRQASIESSLQRIDEILGSLPAPLQLSKASQVCEFHHHWFACVFCTNSALHKISFTMLTSMYYGHDGSPWT